MNDKRLVEFGNYVLSDERKSSVMENPGFPTNPQEIKRRVSVVSDADLANYREERSATRIGLIDGIFLFILWVNGDARGTEMTFRDYLNYERETRRAAYKARRYGK